jgi:hypothetical protein
MIVALDARAPYTAKAIKATGLVEETKALLRAWRPGESTADLRRRAREEALLGKATASRSDDVVAHAFNQRFLAGHRPVAPFLKRLLEQRGAGRWFIDLCLLYTARADVVLRDAITVYAGTRRSAGRDYIDTPSLVRFLEDQEVAGRMKHAWSSNVKEGVAQHVLRQMTEFALAGANRRGIRDLLPFEPSDLAVAWLAYDLHFQGCSDIEVLSHPDWQIWTIDESHVRDRMTRLAGPSIWEFQAAGNVAQITWACRGVEETLDVLARDELR